MSRVRSKFLSLQSVKLKVQQLETRCERLSELSVCPTRDVVSSNKSLLQLCSSLSLVFLQHNLLSDSWSLLSKAMKADARIYSSGEDMEKLWSGRVYVRNNLAYLYHR